MTNIALGKIFLVKAAFAMYMIRAHGDAKASLGTHVTLGAS